MRGLLIKPPWIDLILSGQKTWELRGTNTKKRGEIALILSGSGLIVGSCELANVIGPLSLKEINENFSKHQVPLEAIKSIMAYKKTYAWVLENSNPLKVSVPYKHPRGAVIWVKLPFTHL